MKEITVLNWQSRRATQPMAAAIEGFVRQHPDCAIRQVVRPLSDFEHQSIEDIAQRYDLIVYDHPFSGAIASSQCLVPLDTRLPEMLGNQADAKFLGPSLASYRCQGHVWGAPIDGATQHAVYRQDLLDQLGGDVPQSHAQVLELGRRARSQGMYLGTAIETPHAFMSVLSYMANLGGPITADEQGILSIPEASFVSAYQALEQILSLSAPESLDWNSIAVHEAMVARDDIVYCPAVYGYATYGEQDQRKPLSFAGFAGIQQPFAAGATLGGTALGLSSHCRQPELALAFIRHMLSDEVQINLIGTNYGQPASLAGWDNPDNDQRFNGFYSAARASMEHSWVRPRYLGYVEFQRRSGLIVAEGLREDSTAEQVRGRLLALVAETRSANAQTGTPAGAG